MSSEQKTAFSWNSITERELIRMAIEGHKSELAMTELWERYKKRLYYYIKYRLNFNQASQEFQEKYLIEDILQEVFCDVLTTLQEYRPQYEVSTWIYTVTNKHVIRHIRETQKRQNHSVDIDAEDTIDKYCPDPSQPDLETELKEFERIVLFFVQSLSNKTDKEAFMLYLQNLNTKNISELLGCTQDASRARLGRLMKRFKEFMNREYPEYLNAINLSQIKNLQIFIKKTE